MVDRLSNWNNQDYHDQNLEALAILINEILDKLENLEERIEALEGP